MRRATFVTILAAALAGLAGGTPANALDRGDLLISPEVRAVTKSYPQIAGIRPGGTACPPVCSRPYAQTQAPGCRAHNGAYCDAINLKIEKPAELVDLYEVHITLSWKKTTDNSLMHLYVFTPRHGEEEAEDYALGPSLVDNRTADNPKSVRIGAPDSGTLALTIVNEAGVNDGYTLTVRWVEVDLGPDYDLGLGDFAGDNSFTPSAAAPRTDAIGDGSGFSDGLGYTEDATPAGRGRTTKALIPGPDGQLQEVALPVVARGDRGPALPGGPSSGLVFLMTLLLVSTGAIGFFVVRARRQRA